MILDKIRGFLGIKKKGEEKEIVISCERLEKRVALMEGGRLEEFSIERDSDRQISGSIYKGKVKNLEPGLKIFKTFGVRSLRHGLDRAPDVNRKLDVRHQAVIDLEKRQLRVRYEVIAVRRRAEVGLIVAVCGRSGIVGIERRPGDRALRREQDGKDEHDGSGAHHAVHLSTAF